MIMLNLIAGTSVGFVEALSNLSKSILVGKILKIVLILGLYIGI